MTEQPIRKDMGHAWDAPRDVWPRVLASSWYERSVVGRVSGHVVSHAWVLDYSRVYAGRTRVVAPDRPWRERDARTGHLYPPGTRYWEDWRPVSPKPMRGAFVLFVARDVDDLERLVAAEGYARILDPDEVLSGELHRAAEVGALYGEDGFWTAQAALCAVFQALRRAEFVSGEVWRVRKEDPPSADDESTVEEKARAWFRARLSERIVIADVAEHLHMSESSFSHRFRESAGEPPMQALARMRIEAAKPRVLRGEPLASVAAHTGFCDASHFSRVFTRFEGVSPRAYRAAAGGGRID